MAHSQAKEVHLGQAILLLISSDKQVRFLMKNGKCLWIIRWEQENNIHFKQQRAGKQTKREIL